MKTVIASDICVFIMCGNYGLCGIIGDTAANAMFGLTGGLWHVLPVYLTALYLFFVFNGQFFRNYGKELLSSLLVIAATGFILQIMSGAFYGGAWELFAKCSGEKTGGGLLFGAFMNYICITAGQAPGVFITICFFLLAVIVFMGVNIREVLKKVFIGEKRPGSNVYKTEDDRSSVPVYGEETGDDKKKRKNTATEHVSVEAGGYVQKRESRHSEGNYPEEKHQEVKIRDL